MLGENFSSLDSQDLPGIELSQGHLGLHVIQGADNTSEILSHVRGNGVWRWRSSERRRTGWCRQAQRRSHTLVELSHRCQEVRHFLDCVDRNPASGFASGERCLRLFDQRLELRRNNSWLDEVTAEQLQRLPVCISLLASRNQQSASSQSSGREQPARFERLAGTGQVHLDQIEHARAALPRTSPRQREDLLRTPIEVVVLVLGELRHIGILPAQPLGDLPAVRSQVSGKIGVLSRAFERPKKLHQEAWDIAGRNGVRARGQDRLALFHMTAELNDVMWHETPIHAACRAVQANLSHRMPSAGIRAAADVYGDLASRAL